MRATSDKMTCFLQKAAGFKLTCLSVQDQDQKTYYGSEKVLLIKHCSVDMCSILNPLIASTSCGSRDLGAIQMKRKL